MSEPVYELIQEQILIVIALARCNGVRSMLFFSTVHPSLHTCRVPVQTQTEGRLFFKEEDVYLLFEGKTQPLLSPFQ
jgi:hypothetical protein